MDRRTFITGATCASVAPIAALASAELEELIKAHSEAERQAYWTGVDAEDDAAERELEARTRILEYRPRSLAEASRQLKYLNSAPWDGDAARGWELDMLAASMAGSNA